MVASSGSENRLSRRMDRLLQRKFGKAAAELVALDHEVFMERFKSSTAEGKYATALWAAASHPSLSPALKREAFGDIHMSMHWTGEERMRMQCKLANHQNDLEAARQHIKQIARKRRRLQAENDALRKSQFHLKEALTASERERTRLEEVVDTQTAASQSHPYKQENQILRQESKTLLKHLQRQQHQVASLQEDNRQLARQLEQQGELNQRVTDETRAILAEMVPLNQCDASCPSFDLCQKRILIVGGISRMTSLYRGMIENRGGVFEHHDGYMKRGARTLERCLKRADVVLCPVSCNSHAACSIVKNLAKKHNKRVHMLSNSSLQSISHAIWGANEPHHTLN